MLGMGMGTMAAGTASAAAEGNKPSVWPGASVMKGGTRGYVATPMGQVHYRRMGTGAPVLLLHQTPWFSVEYAKVIPLLAARGLSALAPDRPGYGMSDVPDYVPTIEHYADDLIPVLDALGIGRTHVVGHHTGAAVAAAFVHRHADRVSKLVFDGVPLYNAEERKQRLARPHWDRWLEPDGQHLAARFQMRAARKADAPPSALEGVQWSVMSFFLAGETEWYGHQAAFSYDMEPALRAVRVPTMIMSHTADVLHEQSRRAATLVAGAAFKEFPGGSSQSLFDEPKPWTEAVAGFLTA
jgi:pimeloyl-ACP methyl ester carboxylesterase